MAKTVEIGPYSAYALAVAAGFVGTEEEWLKSLIGPQGEQGASITDVKINGEGHIIVTVHDPVSGEDSTIDAGDIGTVEAVEGVNAAIRQAAEQAVAAVTAQQATSVGAVQAAQSTGVQAVQQAQSTATGVVGDAQTSAVQAVNSARDEALSQVETSTEAAEQAKDAAASSAAAAAGSATDAAASKTAAATSATQAAEAKTGADSAKAAAETAQQAAESAKDSAEVAQSKAEQAETNAQSAAGEIDAGLIVETASGETITIRDSAVAKLRGLRLYGKSVQDGTPTPESPVEIESAGDGGNVTTYVFGQNLIDLMDEEKWGASNGATFEILGNGKIEVTGTNGYSGITYVIPSDTINLLKGKNCVFSRTIDSSTNESGKIIVQIVAYTPSGTKYYSDVNTPITIDADATGANFRLYVNNTGTALETPNTVVFSNLGIYFGDTVQPWDTYRPMQTLTYPTPNGLPGIPVENGGNYTDVDGQQWICDEVDFGRGKYVQRIKYIALTGDMDWFPNNPWDQQAPDIFHYYAILTDKKQDTQDGANNLLCSFFECKTNQGNSLVDTECIYSNYTNWSIYVFLNKSRASTPDLEGFKGWINQNQPVIYYILQNPIETDLTPEQLAAYAALTTYKPNTTVTTDSSPATGLEVNYVADTKTYIDNKLAAISEAILGGTTNGNV